MNNNQPLRFHRTHRWIARSLIAGLVVSGSIAGQASPAMAQKGLSSLFRKVDKNATPSANAADPVLEIRKHLADARVAAKQRDYSTAIRLTEKAQTLAKATPPALNVAADCSPAQIATTLQQYREARAGREIGAATQKSAGIRAAETIKDPAKVPHKSPSIVSRTPRADAAKRGESPLRVNPAAIKVDPALEQARAVPTQSLKSAIPPTAETIRQSPSSTADLATRKLMSESRVSARNIEIRKSPADSVRPSSGFFSEALVSPTIPVAGQSTASRGDKPPKLREDATVGRAAPEEAALEMETAVLAERRPDAGKAARMGDTSRIGDLTQTLASFQVRIQDDLPQAVAEETPAEVAGTVDMFDTLTTVQEPMTPAVDAAADYMESLAAEHAAETAVAPEVAAVGAVAIPDDVSIATPSAELLTAAEQSAFAPAVVTTEPAWSVAESPAETQSYTRTVAAESPAEEATVFGVWTIATEEAAQNARSATVNATHEKDSDSPADSTPAPRPETAEVRTEAAADTAPVQQAGQVEQSPVQCAPEPVDPHVIAETSSGGIEVQAAASADTGSVTADSVEQAGFRQQEDWARQPQPGSLAAARERAVARHRQFDPASLEPIVVFRESGAPAPQVWDVAPAPPAESPVNHLRSASRSFGIPGNALAWFAAAAVLLGLVGMTSTRKS